MAVVKSRELASGTVTQLLVPLKERAQPYLPAVVRLTLEEMMPVLPFPEASNTSQLPPSPMGSSKPNAATRLGSVRSSSASTYSRVRNGRAGADRDGRRVAFGRFTNGSSQSKP